ncbi:elongation factor 1-beta [Candidatus Pacearchaeota archaeon]|nr:elongation factor 1-beta [Candidatus Pacearchaeota archaeon]
MAVAAIKIKLMPESLEVNLNELRKKLEEKILKLGAKNVTFSEENVAFGLKALIATIAWPEQQETGILESELSSIEGISSAQIIDYRRAFG